MNNDATIIPDSSQYAPDVALANAVLKANANITQTAALYKPEYSQVYFPYDGKTSNTLRVGHPTSIGPSGVTLPGKHTYETCKLNATKAAADKSQFVFNMDTTTTVNPSATVTPGDFTANASVFENANAVSYKSVEEADAFIAGLTTDAVYSVEIRLMLNSPKKGAAKCLPEMTPMPQNATIAVWTHGLTAKPILEQANLYVKNGVKQNTMNDDRDFIVMKNTPFPITIRFIANQQTHIADFTKVQIKSKATNEILETETLNMPANGTPTPTFFNFNTATQACTIVNGPDFVYESERVVFKQSLQADISFVGLTTKGYLYQFVNGQDINPQPINTIVYDPKNPAVIDSSYELSINEKLSTIVVKNTNTKMEKIIVNLTPVDISLNKNTDWLANNPMTTINCGRISGSDIPQMQITKTQPLVSKTGYYKMFISPTNELVVVASIRSANNAFAVMPDYRSGKLFLADTNEKSQTMIHVPKSYQKPTTSFTKYPDMYPLQELQKNYKTVLNANCEAECNKIGCDHYYESKTQKGKKTCTISNNTSNYVFAPQQNNSILASTLYVTNKRITTKDYKKDAEQLDAYPYMSNGLNDKILDYNLANFEYSETADLTSFIGGQAIVSNTVGLAFGNNSQDKVIGQSMSVYMTDGKEGFADFDVNLPERTLARIDNQIIPLQNVYLNNQGRVMQNRVDISNTITDISANYYTQANNNKLYDFSGNDVIYSLKPDRTITPAILKDQQTMLEEHNNLYIVSTITVATLLIAAIFVASD